MARTGMRKPVRRDVLRCHIALDVLAEPSIPTERLVERYYATTSTSSLYKTLARDREALAEEGIHLTATSKGTSKVWSADRARTLAAGGLSDDDARGVQQALRPLISQEDPSGAAELGRALVRLGRDLSGNGLPQHDVASPEALGAIATALGVRKPCELDYQALGDARGVTRILLPYGIFELAGATYVVGLRRKHGFEDAVRTLNLDRVRSARVLSDEPAYEIPADFRIEDYRLLPFEMGDGPATAATFFVPKAQVVPFRAEARRRGRVSARGGGALTWSITVRDIARAASWAPIAGVIPLDPPELVAAWRHVLEGVAANGN